MTERFDWTPKHIETLKALYLQGLSARQIAEEIGHVTRNAVIGKLNRLGYAVKGGRRETKPLPMPTGEHGSCQWPLWGHDEPISHRYCGEKAVAGRSYCPTHYARSVSRVQPQDDEEYAA